MRTTIDINKGLLQQVMKLAHVPTKKQAVVLSLETFIRQKRIERLANRLGKGEFCLSQEDLEKMRAR